MGHQEFQKQEGRILTPSFFVLLSLSLLGMFLILVRCVKGIGAVSNMSDGYPWGIWIAYDVATGTAIAFTITNGTGKDQVFHVFFYKADKDFSKTRILREDRQAIPAGSGVEIAPYLFTEPGVYRLNVKTADNTQLMQRTWKVVDLKR